MKQNKVNDNTDVFFFHVRTLGLVRCDLLFCCFCFNGFFPVFIHSPTNIYQENWACILQLCQQLKVTLQCVCKFSLNKHLVLVTIYNERLRLLRRFTVVWKDDFCSHQKVILPVFKDVCSLIRTIDACLRLLQMDHLGQGLLFCTIQLK